MEIDFHFCLRNVGSERKTLNRCLFWSWVRIKRIRPLSLCGAQLNLNKTGPLKHVWHFAEWTLLACNQNILVKWVIASVETGYWHVCWWFQISACVVETGPCFHHHHPLICGRRGRRYMMNVAVTYSHTHIVFRVSTKNTMSHLIKNENLVQKNKKL